MQKQYYPYAATDGKHKFYIITKDGNKVYFGAKGYSDYTIHKNNKKKEAYIKRHEKNENWTASGIDTAGWWSVKYLWSYPTKKEAYKYIKDNFLNK